MTSKERLEEIIYQWRLGLKEYNQLAVIAAITGLSEEILKEFVMRDELLKKMEGIEDVLIKQGIVDLDPDFRQDLAQVIKDHLTK